MKLLNFRPLLFIAVSTCLGILCAYLYKFVGALLPTLLIVVYLTVSTCFCIFFSKDGKLKRNVIFSIITLFVFTLSFFNFKILADDYTTKITGGLTYQVKARVIESNVDGDMTTVLLSDIELHGAYEIDTNYKMVLYVYEKCDFDVGDKLSFTARIDDMSPFYEGRLSSSYISNGIKFSTVLTENTIEILGNDKTIFERVNVKIRDTLKSHMDGDSFATAYAMICGNSDFMDAEILRNYRAVGVAHVFAVSGLHIGFLALVLRFILLKLKVNKFVRFFLTVSILIFYSGICGFSSSAVRATIMCAVSLLAGLLGKKYDTISSISLSLIIVLILNPFELFSVGFLLSFSVVYGITILNKPISNLLKFMPEKLAKSLSVVISAQLFSLPICLMVFKEFSVISIIANLIFIPLVGGVYVFTFTSIILSLIFGAGQVFLFLPNYIFVGINALFSLSDYSGFMVGGILIGGFAIPYYLSLLFSSYLFNIKKKLKTLLVIFLCAFTVVGTTVYNVSDKNTLKVYVSGGNTVSATVFTIKSETVVVLNSVNYFFNTNRLERALNRAGVKEIDRLILPENALGCDVQLITSALSYFGKINNVYYTSELTDLSKELLIKMFPETNFYQVEKDGNLEFSGLKIGFEFDGYILNCEYRDFNIALFSRLGKNAERLYGYTLDQMDLIIANDYAEMIEYTFSPKEMMTYQEHGSYKNGASEGNYLIKIK